MKNAARAMKSSLTAVAVSSALLFSATASAELFSLEAEAQYWQAKPSGGHSSTALERREYSWNDSGQVRLSASLYHFIPLIPNIKVETQKLEFTGDRQMASIDFNTDTVTIDLSHETFTLFYAPLDNGLTQFHFGVSLKQFDGFVAENYGYTDQPMWMVNEDIYSGYVRGSFSLPFTGFSVMAQGHVGISDHDSYDVEAAVRYRFLDSMALDGYVSIGYRALKLHLDDANSLSTDYEFKGPFLNLALRF